MVAADAPRSGGMRTRLGIGQRRVDELVELVLVGGQPDQLLGGHPVGERHLVVVDHLVEARRGGGSRWAAGPPTGRP